MLREEDASSEGGSVKKLEIELSPEGRRNNRDEVVIVPCLENEGNENGGQGLSTEAFNVENNSSSHEMSLPKEGEAIEALIDQGQEDLINMGLVLVLDQNKGLETQIIEGNEMDLNEKEMKILVNEGSPKSNQNSTFLSKTKGLRDQVAASEIEEEFFQIRQNKRNKKVLNKRIRSV
ncbi:hypothetical protein PVK06_009586 [Gossypium arboreum]|uniref:Uncharacterized protein n=1 Tax=Gossypium arboreum TaxID=29729 RepID=A0ABR0QP98_GOSAR|nr:hypothetical protein PVK06_009586 [Gossypium arboreum]